MNVEAEMEAKLSDEVKMAIIAQLNATEAVIIALDRVQKSRGLRSIYRMVIADKYAVTLGREDDMADACEAVFGPADTVKCSGQMTMDDIARVAEEARIHGVEAA